MSALRFPASLEAPYHTVDELHAALRSTVAAHDSLTLEWLRDDASAQVEGVDDDDVAAPPLAVLRTRDTTRAAPSGAPRRLRALVLFGEHAREAITSEVALRVAALLAGGGGGGGDDDGALGQRAASLRRRVDVALMPLVNVLVAGSSSEATSAAAATRATSTSIATGRRRTGAAARRSTRSPTASLAPPR